VGAERVAFGCLIHFDVDCAEGGFEGCWDGVEREDSVVLACVHCADSVPRK
jgi:hypothetical protein